MQSSAKPHPQVPNLDLSLLDRQENKEHLITLLRSLADAQMEIDADLPDDPILKLIKISQLGLEQLKLNKSGLTSRSDLSSISNRSKDTERELRRLKREISHQKRALENYEFFFKQPEVAETVNTALGKLNTLKCAFCHKFFTSQHFLDQHVVRRHPELAGSGAEKLRSSYSSDMHTFSSRQRQIEALNSTFLSQFESLQTTVLTVNAQKTHLAQAATDPTSEEAASRLREAMSLQAELNRLLEQQQRILSDQASKIREIQSLQDHLASYASPPFSCSESQQTSFFERQSIGEAAFEGMRSPRIEDLATKGKLESDCTGRLAEMAEEWRAEGVTKRRVDQTVDADSPAKIEVVVGSERRLPATGEKRGPTGLPPALKRRDKVRKPSLKCKGDADRLRSKVALLKKKEATCPVLKDKYADALKSLYPHSASDIESTKSAISAVISAHISAGYVPLPPSSDFQLLRQTFSSLSQHLTSHSAPIPESIRLGDDFCEGRLVCSTELEYREIDGRPLGTKLERQRESMLSLDYEDSVSFSIRWGDEDEESGEWRGIGPEEARRLGFFFR